MAEGRSEQYVLAEAIRQGSLDFLIDQGFEPRFFITHYSLAKKLWKYYDDTRMLPSRKRIEEKFKEMEWDPPDERDVPEYISDVREAYVAQLSSEFLQKSIKLLKEGEFASIQDLAKEHLNEAEAAYRPNLMVEVSTNPQRINKAKKLASEQETGKFSVPFAHPLMNRYMGGAQSGKLYCYVGRPKEGKTHAALLDAHNAWKHEANVMYVSIEMDSDDIGMQFDTLQGHFSNKRLMRGEIKRYTPEGRAISDVGMVDYEEYFYGLKNLGGRLHILTRSSVKGKITPAYIEAKARQYGIDFLIVDYMGIVDIDERYSDRREQMRLVSAAFKNMAADLGVPVLSPYHINRAGEKGEVTLANFADSDDVGKIIDAAVHVKKQPFRDGKETEEDLEETGSYLLTYNLIASRYLQAGVKFAWDWNFDTGVRTPLFDYAFEGLDSMESGEDDWINS